MRWLHAVLAVTALNSAGFSCSGGFEPECYDDDDYTHSLDVDVRALHQRPSGVTRVALDPEALFFCAEPDPSPDINDDVPRCLHYVLASKLGLVVDFLPGREVVAGKVLATDNAEVAVTYQDKRGTGWVLVTSASGESDDCVYLGRIANLSGEFEVTFGDQSFTKGVFFTPGAR